MSQPLLKLGGVSRATNVPLPTLGRWLDRGTIKHSPRDKASGGSGDYRQFSRNTIVQIAIARKLIELGIPAGPANAAASLFTEHGQRNREPAQPFDHGRTILALRPTGAVVLNAQFDADFSELSDFGVAFVAVDCGKVCKEIDEAINSTIK